MMQQVRAQEMRISRPQQEATWLMLYAVFLVMAAGGTGMLILWKPAAILGAVYFTQSYWYVVLFKLVLMLGLPWTWFAASGYSFRDLQPKWRLTAKSGAWVVVAFAAGYFLNASYIGQIHAAIQGGLYTDVGLRVGVGLLVPLISAGLPEEFYFRGLLQTRLEMVGGRVFAILTSVTLFTAWHLPSRYLLAKGTEGVAGNFWSVALNTGAPVFLVGLIFAPLYDRYRSLIPVIALHWGIDTLPHMASFFGINH